MRIVSLLGVALFVFGVFLQLRTWRRQRRVRPGLIAVSQVAALGASVAFSALIERPPTVEWWVVLLGTGVVLGVIYGGTMVIDRTERGVVMSYSIPAMVTWSALMVITQLATIFGGSVPIVIYSLAIANLGINLGMNGRVLWGYSTLRGAPAMGLLALTIGLMMPWSGIAPAGAAQIPVDCPAGSRLAILDAAGNEVPLGTPGATFGCLPIEGGSSGTSIPPTGLNYAGTYRASFMVFVPEYWTPTMTFTLVVEESGAAFGNGSAIDSYTHGPGPATVGVDFECLGPIDAAGSGSIDIGQETGLDLETDPHLAHFDTVHGAGYQSGNVLDPVEWPDRGATLAPHVDQVGYQCRHVAGLLTGDRRDLGSLHRAEIVGFFQEIEVADDRRQRGAQLVRHRGD